MHSLINKIVICCEEHFTFTVSEPCEAEPDQQQLREAMASLD